MLNLNDIVMRKLFLSFSLLLFLLFSIISCSNKTKDYWGDLDNIADEDIEQIENNPAIVALGWIPQTDFTDLPSYIDVYKSPMQLESKNAIAFIAVADMKKANFIILGEKNGYKTPSQFYEQSSLPVILNAGFFWDGASLSLICKEGTVLCPNSQTASKDWVTIYNPTRGAFCITNSGSCEAVWTYTNNENITYSYPQPAENKYGETPKATPSAIYPAGGSVLNVKTAIGGGPVLIKDNQIKDTYVEELFEIGADASHPRSAVGSTKDNKIIFFVCEGRNMTSGVPGLTTKEVAIVLQKMGCVEALNLDGGGSSCMLINGKEVIKSSDGSQRKIVTAIGLN